MKMKQELQFYEGLDLKKLDVFGYVNIKLNGIWIKEHRYIVEQFIGRTLTKDEVVHHINEDKTDNRISNLMLFPNNKAHAHFHRQIRQFGMTNPRKREINDRWKEFK